MTTVEETQELIRQVQELISQAPYDASLPPILAELQQTLNLLLSGAEEGPQQQQKEAAADTLRPPPIGSKCAIPFPSDEDEDDDQYYLLLGVVISYNNTNDEATVILATPITQDTVPCPVFLSGSQECHGPCPYNQSHGYTVPVDMLLPYEAMDIANVYAYNRVWVRQPNQLWVRGRLVNISSNNDENNTATCQVISDQGDHPTFTVGIDSIVPRITLDDYDEDDDDEDDENEDEDEDDIGSELEEEERLQMETIGRINADEWGGWQTHTTGFGAKMLAKMGYVHGQGLGRHGQGRVEPVQAYIKKGRRGPDSRSGLGVLDKVKKKNKKRRRKRRSSNNNAQQQQKAILSSSVSSKSNQTAVFDFVNILLKSQDTKIPSAPAAQETSSSSRNDTQPPSSKSGKKEASYRSLAKLQAEIETTSKQFAHSLEALRRNKGTIMEYKFKEKSKAIKQKLDALQIEANAMESSLKRAKDQEKMVSF